MKTIHTVAVNGEQYSILDAHAVERAAKALCPAFSVSGRVVQCEPMAACPLQVTTQLQEEQRVLTLTHTGKNLFDAARYNIIDYYYNWSTGERVTSNSYSCIEKLMPVGHLKGKTITLNHTPGDLGSWTSGGICFYTGETLDTFISGAGGNEHTYVVPENAEYMGFSIPREFADGTQIQIELGDAVTEYEPYREKNFTATPGALTHDWGEIPAMEGVNTLFCSSGTVCVEGHQDLIRLIGKLTQGVAADG